MCMASPRRCEGGRAPRLATAHQKHLSEEVNALTKGPAKMVCTPVHVIGPSW